MKTARVIKDMGRQTKDFVTEFAQGALYGMYALPSGSRILDEFERETNKELKSPNKSWNDVDHHSGYFGGYFTSAAFSFYTLTLGPAAINSVIGMTITGDSKGAWLGLAPYATNFGSLMHEWYKSSKEKIEKRDKIEVKEINDNSVQLNDEVDHTMGELESLFARAGRYDSMDFEGRENEKIFSREN